jgi:hypothetical protein
MERRELEHRRKEFHREDIIKQLKNDAVLNGIIDSNERVENKRRLRGQQIREEEYKTQEALIRVRCLVRRSWCLHKQIFTKKK